MSGLPGGSTAIALAALSEAGINTEVQEEQVEEQLEETNTGGDQDGSESQDDEEGHEESAEKLVPQSKVNEIVENRLARERRKMDRELATIKGQVSMLAQVQAKPPVDDSEERSQQFMRDFATDPEGALKRFQAREATQVQSHQAQVVAAVREAASDALDNLKDKYEDFEGLAPNILQELQSDQVAQKFLASLGGNISVADYEMLLDRAYQSTRAKVTASVITQGKKSVQQEIDVETAAKRKASVPAQRAASPKKATTPQQEEDALFKMQKDSLRRI